MVCERRSSGDDAEESKFFFIEITIFDVAGGSTRFDGC
jgi:hypothetical protein